MIKSLNASVFLLLAICKFCLADEPNEKVIQFELENYNFVFIGVSKDAAAKKFIPLDTQEYNIGLLPCIISGSISVDAETKTILYRSIDQNDAEQWIDVKVDLSTDYLGISSPDDLAFSAEPFNVKVGIDHVKISIFLNSLKGKFLVCFLFGKTPESVKNQISIDPELKLWKWDFRKISFGGINPEIQR